MKRGAEKWARWPTRLASRARISFVVLCVAATVPLWAPWHQVRAWNHRRRWRRFRARANELPSVDLLIEGDGLVIAGRRDHTREAIAFADIERGAWCELCRDGSFAAANTPPEHIVELQLRDGTSRVAHTELASWRSGPILWARELVARGILPHEPEHGGCDHHDFPNVFVLGALLAWAAVAALAVRALR